MIFTATDLQNHNVGSHTDSMPENESTELETVFVCTELAHSKTSDCGPYPSYLATLNSSGSCVIKTKGILDHKWSEQVADLTEIWTNSSQNTNKIVAHNSVTEEAIQSSLVQFTAFDWMNHSQQSSSLSIACTSTTGQCIFFEIPMQIDESSKTTIRHVADLQQQTRINQLKWISLGSRSFICTANVLGHVRLYCIFHDELNNHVLGVSACLTLADWQLLCSIESLNIEHDAESNQLILLLCIGSRIACFFVPIDDWKSSQTIMHSIAKSSITGKCTIV